MRITTADVRTRPHGMDNHQGSISRTRSAWAIGDTIKDLGTLAERRVIKAKAREDRGEERALAGSARQSRKEKEQG